MPGVYHAGVVERHTRWTQTPLPSGLRVRIPPPVPIIERCAMNRPEMLRAIFERADKASEQSDDPHTQVGVVVGRLKSSTNFLTLFTGCNHLPPLVVRCDQRLRRPDKYHWLMHGELDIVSKAARTGTSLRDCWMFITPYPPCAVCAKVIVESGISRVYVQRVKTLPEHWRESIEISEAIFRESNVPLYYVDRNGQIIERV